LKEEKKKRKRKEMGSWSILFLWANVECCIISSIEIEYAYH